MKIERFENDLQVRLKIKGSIGSKDAKQLLEHAESLTPGPGAALELDMESVSMVDSAGLEALLTCKEHCNAIGAELSLVNVNQRIARILRITRLDREMTVRS